MLCRDRARYAQRALEAEVLVPMFSGQSETLGFQLMMAELIDQLQDAPKDARQCSKLRGIVAEFGDAYFFYNQTGDLCLLTGFLVDR